MLDRRDPEYQQSRADANWRLDQLWLSGKIGDATLVRSLMINGDLPDEATTHLNLLKLEKRRCPHT